MQKKSLWSFGTREVVFAAIGAALYGVLAALTNILNLPGSSNVSMRPAVSIVFFFGLAFGPIVGFITGFLGNIIADLLSGATSFWFWWHLGNGLMGLVAGLFIGLMTNYRSWRDILIAEIAVVLGAFVGMAVASISDMWVSGMSLAAVIAEDFVPAFLPNIIAGLVLTPILMVAYSAIIARSGRGQTGKSGWETAR
jgi:energy-coupling factor transport system substrate-specific component